MSRRVLVMTALAAMLLGGSVTMRAQSVIAWGNNSQGQTNVPPAATNILSLAAGAYHALALTSDGEVVGWGKDSDGQAEAPVDATNLVAVAAGGAHSLGVRDDGSVLAWGRDWDGQTEVPASATNVVALAAGWAHSVALRADGTVVAWGNNEFGQTDLAFLAMDAIAVAAGYYHNIALRTDGTVVTWGLEYPTPPSLTNVVAVAAGWEHCLALRANGSVVAWGDNAYGQSSVPAAATNVVAISAGYYHNLALRADGAIIAWGKPVSGVTSVPPGLADVAGVAAGEDYSLALVAPGPPRFGAQIHSAVAHVTRPAILQVPVAGSFPLSFQWFHDGAPVPGATNHTLVLADAEPSHAGNYVLVATNLSGSATSGPVNLVVQQGPANLAVGAWYDDVTGQCEIPRTVTSPCAIAAGSSHVLALNLDGTVAAWGKNWSGQTDVPAGATNVVAVAAGGAHSLALKADGTVIGWGRDWDGQATVPATATNVTAIAAGWAHSLALKADGTLVAWGNNDYGQASASILALDVTAIAAGYYHNLALRSDRTVLTWAFDYATPAAATNIVAVAAGWEHCLALRADGAVIAWGDNSYGQSTVPVSATNVVAISAGYYHNLAAKADGSVLVWGKPCLGVTNVPGGLRNIARLTAGEDFCVVLAASGPAAFGRQLQTVVAHPGGQAVLNANVVANSSTALQWYRNGIAVEGATNACLRVTSPVPSAYVLVAANAAGQVSSTSINLSVRPAAETITTIGAWGENMAGQCNVSAAAVTPREVVAGPFHCLALNADGTVAAWGKNWDGQTAVPANATNVIAVAAGGHHSLALSADGSVVGWGRDWDRQASGPTAATNVTGVAAGLAHSLALKADGTVLAWGNNDCGQTTVPSTATGVIAVAAGYNHSLALRADHRVVGWGLECTPPASATNVVAIAGGWWHSLALRADGRVIAWGNNSYDQCAVPVSATNIVAIAAGYSHSLALRADGTVITWGKGCWGVTNVPSGLRDVSRVAAGRDYSLAVVQMGPPLIRLAPASTGTHVGGQAILTADVQGTHPLTLRWAHEGTPISGATNAQLVLPNVPASAAGEYTLEVTSGNGFVRTESSNLSLDAAPAVVEELGPRNVLVGAPLVLLGNVSGAAPLSCQWRLNGRDLADGGGVSGATSQTLSVATAKCADSGSYSLVVSNEAGCVTGAMAQVSVSSLVTWGNNARGQTTVPIGTADFVAIAAGGDHSLAVRADNALVAWGDGTSNRNTPPLPAMPVVAVAEGEAHSLALRADGTVLAWGDNAYGQTNVPASATNVIKIAAGAFHSLALRLDGKVVAWGANDYGQRSYITTMVPAVVDIAGGDTFSLALLGNGVVAVFGAFPPAPASATNVTAIAAGGRHALALRGDKKVVAWGLNYFGQTTLPDLGRAVTAIAAGGDHSVLLYDSYTVLCCGADDFGQASPPRFTSYVSAISAGGAHSVALVANGLQPPALRPFPRTATIGQPTTLNAGALNQTSAQYQWQLNGVDVAGATTTSLTLGSIHWTNTGNYSLVVSNASGRTTGPAIVMTVLRTPLRFDTSPAELRMDTNALHLKLLGASGVGPVVIHASSDFLSWQPIFTNPAVIGVVEFSDAAAASEPLRLYRATEGEAPGPVVVSMVAAPAELAGRKVPLCVTGLGALGPVVIYGSSDLAGWQPLFTNPPTIGPLQYLEAETTAAPHRFYRASEQR